MIKHLLPRANAWNITIDKTLRRWFVGIAEWPQDVKDFVDGFVGEEAGVALGAFERDVLVPGFDELLRPCVGDGVHARDMRCEASA